MDNKKIGNYALVVMELQSKFKAANGSDDPSANDLMEAELTPEIQTISLTPSSAMDPDQFEQVVKHGLKYGRQPTQYENIIDAHCRPDLQMIAYKYSMEIDQIASLRKIFSIDDTHHAASVCKSYALTPIEYLECYRITKSIAHCDKLIRIHYSYKIPFNEVMRIYKELLHR